jgi:2,4-dienoyl-CoA reductase-like NADH-dependent reductase (Old Yellow Enzyme family)
MANLDHLLSTLTLRGITIRNRILSTGHQTFLARNGQITDELIAYHEARAKGGVGLIILESARFHESAISDLPEIHITHDAQIEGFRKLADAIHQHGAKVIGQLSHSGRCSHMRRDGARGVVYAPSAIPDHRFHTMPRAMSTQMVGDIILALGQSAKRMADAGLDGVEILASHGLLFAQFINEGTNQRNDCYGGAFENRMRPLCEALRKARQAFGPNGVVGIRISAEELEQDGMDVDVALSACKHLANLGLVDYINTTTGSMAGPGGSIHVVPPMEYASGYVVPKAKAIRDATGLPVFVAGRINQPQDADRIISSGQADMCGMTRAMIADDQMPNKAAAGDLDSIRACIGCNQGCIGHFHLGYSITCIQNPVSGRETKLAHPSIVSKPRQVLIAGGGPAGLKAAVVAGQAGHTVTLFEACTRLGGQVNLAAQLPDRAEFGGLVSNLVNELSGLDVTIRLNTRVNRALIEELSPDAVILATGSQAYQPMIEGAEEAHTVTAHQVMRGQVNPGANVLVADWRCDWVGIGIAEKMALAGRHVRLAVNGMQAGVELQPYQRDHLIGKIHRAGVEVIPYSRLFGVDVDTAYLTHTVTGDAIICNEVDTVILAYGASSDVRLEEELIGLNIPIHLAGDCLSPRTAEEAVLEGMHAGLAL